MSNVLVRMGDIFEGSSQVTVLPCSGKGTVSSATRRWLEMFSITSPKDLPIQPGFGEISELLPFSGDKKVTKYVVFAASVLNDFSSEATVKRISAQLGQLTQIHPDIRLIETPLLGTGAGGLKTEVAGKALYEGFYSTAHPDATLCVFVFDRERQTTLDTLYKHMNQEKAIKISANLDLSILFLSADPSDLSRLRLGEEAREIHEKLRSAKLRDQFMLEMRMSVRPEDISQAMLDVEPQIVHFSGHGSSKGELCVENKAGQIHPIRPEALASLFEQFFGQVKCVILNACYSEVQANAIAKYVDYVIGMSHEISDKAAIAFSIGFYQALGAGKNIKEAYQLGCVQIRLQGIPEHLTPILHSDNQKGCKISARLRERVIARQFQSRIRDDIEYLLCSDDYPGIMSISGEMVTNPVWNYVPKDERERLVKTFHPSNDVGPRIMSLDVFLVRANDPFRNPRLLTYFSGKPKSGWQAYLFPFRSRALSENINERFTLSEKDIALFLGLAEESVKVSSLGEQYTISIKPDPGYSEIVAYVFEFCSVQLQSPPKWLSIIDRDCEYVLENSTRRFRWFHPEEIEDENSTMRLNSDVVRAIHQLFSTTIPMVPESVPKDFLQ